LTSRPAKKAGLALEEVMRSATFILLATQKNASDDEPATEAIYEIGTLASVLQLLKLPDGTVKVLVEGAQRAKVVKYTDCSEYYEAKAVALGDTMGERAEAEAFARLATTEFESFVKLNKKVSPEVVGVVQQIEDHAKLADTIASHLALKIPDRQAILETTAVTERLEKVLGLMESEISVLQVEKRIRTRVKRQMEKTQREYFLNEQMKAIQKEMSDAEGRDEFAEIEDKIKKNKLSKEAREKATHELKKLRQISPMSPEGNDHYLEVDYDLSSVMFITTANTLNIPPPLMDRMEIIRIAGYTEDEKVEIARKHLIPNVTTKHGLGAKEWAIDDEALLTIIRRYTREAGVRNLERELSTLIRKAVKELILSEKKSVKASADNLADYLGVPKYRYGEIEDTDLIGVVTGLAWTDVGGELLTIEAVMMPGKGRMTVTGNLRDVMKESISAAASYVRSSPGRPYASAGG
jgi:ATP-dependent Lon protease